MAPGKTQVARAAAGEERSKRNEPVTVKENPLKVNTGAELDPEFESKNLKRSFNKFRKIPRPPQYKNLKTHQAKPLSPNPPSKPIKEKPSRMIQQPDLPNKYTDIITAKNGCELKLIIEKKLFKTDLEKDANRLSIPKGQLKAEFLGQKEHIILQEKVEGHYKGIEVPLVQPCREVSTILLKNWKYGNGNSYMLSSQWNDVAEKNGLKVDDIIQLWSFRVNHELWMALVKL